VLSVGLCSSSDVIITFDPNWHLLYSSSAGAKDLSNDTQITVISSLGLRYENVKRFEKLAAKFPVTTLSYSTVKIASSFVIISHLYMYK